MFNPDGRLLASASRDGTIRLWDATPLKGDEGQEVLPLQHSLEVYGLAISPDGTQVATAGLDPIVRVWDAMTGQVIQTFSDITQVDHRLAAATGQGKQQHEENATRTPHI